MGAVVTTPSPSREAELASRVALLGLVQDDGAGHGAWSHVTAFSYAYAFKFFRFDATTGGLVGWTVIRQEAVVDPSGDTYTAEGGAEVYNASGALVARGCSTTSASRFQ